MGRREVVIYTCDGCHASSTVGRDESAQGFHRILFPGGSEKWLCTVCYGAVDWVCRFQGITRAPKVHVHNGRHTLRRQQ
jgi:hypothetical protein